MFKLNRIFLIIFYVILGAFSILIIASGKGFTLLMFPVFVLVHTISPVLSPIIKRIPLPLFFKFFAIGLLSGLLTEYLVLLTGFGFFSPDLMSDFILSLGIYGTLPIIWFFLLKRYSFSLKSVFILAGIWGVSVEQNFAVLLSFNPLAYLYIFTVYGSFISIPFVLTRGGFVNIKRKEGKTKYIVAFFSQFLAYIVGFLWMAIMKLIV